MESWNDLPQHTTWSEDTSVESMMLEWRRMLPIDLEIELEISDRANQQVFVESLLSTSARLLHSIKNTDRSMAFMITGQGADRQYMIHRFLDSTEQFDDASIRKAYMGFVKARQNLVDAMLPWNMPIPEENSRIFDTGLLFMTHTGSMPDLRIPNSNEDRISAADKMSIDIMDNTFDMDDNDVYSKPEIRIVQTKFERRNSKTTAVQCSTLL